MLGERLGRLSLRHVFALRLLESPVVGAAAREARVSDVLLAARVCGAQDEADLRRRLLEPGTRWGRARIALRSWWWTRRPGRLRREWMALRHWLAAEWAGCPQLLPSAGSRKYQLDWTVLLAARVMRETGCARTAAWWWPAAEAVHMRLAWEEMDGKEFRVLTRDLRDELREMGHEI